MAKQPESCRQMIEAGWSFEWHAEAHFVAAVHPLGGKQSIVEVRWRRNGMNIDEVGKAICDLLNGKRSEITH